MPLTEAENKKRKSEYHKRYYQNNKEKIKKQKQEYNKKNKEKISKQTKEYREKNKEKKKEYNKEYKQTPEGKKRSRIATWKKYNIVPPCSWDEFHDKWEKATNCEDCDVVMTLGERYRTSTTKCVDHDHSITDGSPNFRAFVCHGCNIRRGK